MELASVYNSTLKKEGTFTDEYIPLFLKSADLNVLLIGGGNRALKMLEQLISFSSEVQITVISEFYTNDFVQFAVNNKNVELREELFRPHHLKNKQLVLAGISDNEFVSTIRELVNRYGILFHASENAEYSDFFIGSSDQILKFEQVEMNSGQAKIRKEWYHFSVRKLLGYTAGVLGIMLAGHLLFTLIPLSEIASGTSNLISQLDSTFLYFMLGGFIAQMIDGALGMAYGVSATTFLLSLGIPPAVASMSVHTSEIFTSGVSGFMHLRFGNVNNKLFKTLLIPGITGAILGAYVLTEFEEYNHYIKPIVGLYTLILGVLIIWKVVRKNVNRKKVRNVGWLATAGGFLDAIGGGGWGPVVSSTLIARGKNPRLVIGSVNLAEFFVSVASSFTFFTLIGAAHWQIFTGLILGGVCAAPIAAYLSQKLNVKAMMLMVGIVVIIVSLRIIIMTFL